MYNIIRCSPFLSLWYRIYVKDLQPVLILLFIFISCLFSFCKSGPLPLGSQISRLFLQRTITVQEPVQKFYLADCIQIFPENLFFQSFLNTLITNVIHSLNPLSWETNVSPVLTRER